MYSGNGQAPTSLHVPHVTCHTGSGCQGLMFQTVHILPILGAFALSWHFSSLRATLCLFVSGNWINVSSPNPQITCCVFSVLVNDVANFVNWQSFVRIDRKHHTHPLIARYLAGGYMLFFDQSQAFNFPPVFSWPRRHAAVKTAALLDITRLVAVEQSTPL